MSEIGSPREIRDIKTPQDTNEFKQIKPEEGTSFQEAQGFWDNLFEKEDLTDRKDGAGSETFDEVKKLEPESSEEQEICYYDDNGKLYRSGNELVPSNEYEINGYQYKTSENGSIISAEGTLHLKEREGRLQIKDSIKDIGKGDEREGDDRGHLIGDQFDGSNGLENMIPQDATVNRNDFKNFENSLAREVKDGKVVEYKVEPVYEDGSRRPLTIVVTYSIEGEDSIRIFPNGDGT